MSAFPFEKFAFECERLEGLVRRPSIERVEQYSEVLLGTLTRETLSTFAYKSHKAVERRERDQRVAGSPRGGSNIVRALDVLLQDRFAINSNEVHRRFMLLCPYSSHNGIMARVVWAHINLRKETLRTFGFLQAFYEESIR